MKVAIETHYYSPGHQGLIKGLQEHHVQSLEEMFEILQKKETTDKILQKTANHLRSVYQALDWNMAFIRFKELMELQEYNSALVGEFMASNHLMRRVAIFYSEIMDKNLAEHILRENVPLSILVDETTDRKHENYLIILVQKKYVDSN